MSVGLPLVEPVNLVQGNDEGRLLLDEQVNGLEGLRFEPVRGSHSQARFPEQDARQTADSDYISVESCCAQSRRIVTPL